MKRIVVTAKEVRGTCRAGIKPGAKFVIEGGNLLLDESDAVCATAFASMYYRVYAQYRGAALGDLHYIQCPDTYIWGPEFGKGTVLFEIKVENSKRKTRKQ